MAWSVGKTSYAALVEAEPPTESRIDAAIVSAPATSASAALVA